jgi:hypothetical protein
MVRYFQSHLENGDYHLEAGKGQGRFIGTLANEWGLDQEPIRKGDHRFKAFAELDLEKLKCY